MKERTSFWIRIALINLCIVALLGTLMRYKIGFQFPYFEQKYIQEAHSHFAFSGWITHTLYIILTGIFRKQLTVINERAYRFLILVNLFSAYAMLVSFFMQGYGPVSIAFATLSIITGYVFSFYALKDVARLPPDNPARNWIKAAIWFGIISTLGTIVLSYMMASRQYDQETYLGSVFFYLHFQYNGWFLFACIAFLMNAIQNANLNPAHNRRAFLFFFLSGVPTYFLSTLWAKLPVWLYILVILASVFQMIGWWYLIRIIKANSAVLKQLFPKFVRLLFLIVFLAFSLKLFLQLISTIPSVSQLAFGFRPVVIAYLHLVLLLIVSVFLLAYLYGINLLKQSRFTRLALSFFVTGAILNEMVLAAQGIASFSYTIIPHVNKALFGIACILAVSAISIWLCQHKKSRE